MPPFNNSLSAFHGVGVFLESLGHVHAGILNRIARVFTTRHYVVNERGLVYTIEKEWAAPPYLEPLERRTLHNPMLNWVQHFDMRTAYTAMTKGANKEEADEISKLNSS